MARLFGGTNGYVWNTNMDPINGTGLNWTVAFWAKLTSWGVNGALIAPAYAANQMPILMFPGPIGPSYTDQMIAGFYRQDAGNFRGAVDPNAIVKGKWTHWAGQWDQQAVNIRLWRDGARVATNTFDNTGNSGPAAAPSGTDLYVGRGWGGTTYINGQIEDMAVWTGQTVPDEVITRLATDRSLHPNTILTSSLKAYWPMYGTALEPTRTAEIMNLDPSGDTGPVNGIAQEPGRVFYKQLFFKGGMVRRAVDLP